LVVLGGALGAGCRAPPSKLALALGAASVVVVARPVSTSRSAARRVSASIRVPSFSSLARG
jgi:hypothetical protein